MAQGDTASLLGTFGGRFLGGAVGESPECAWKADVLTAVERKVKKIITYPSNKFQEYRLLIYANSNAVQLIYDWPRLFSSLEKFRDTILSRCSILSNLDRVEIICDNWLLSLTQPDISYRELVEGMR